MTRRPIRTALLALVLSIALGGLIGGVSQLTAVSPGDPRTGSPPLVTIPPVTSPPQTPRASEEPSPGPTPTPEAGGEVWLYTMASGDSVSALAIRFGTTTSELLALNPEYAENQDLVAIGATMVMPCTPIAAAEDRC